MAVRRQAYEWRNVMPVGKKVSLNNHPVLKPNQVHTIALSKDIPIDIFVGNIGEVIYQCPFDKVSSTSWKPVNLNLLAAFHFSR